MLEWAQCFFRIRAVGQKTGLITSWAAVRSASCEASRLLGPADRAADRPDAPTSRQRMQRLR